MYFNLLKKCFVHGTTMEIKYNFALIRFRTLGNALIQACFLTIIVLKVGSGDPQASVTYIHCIPHHGGRDYQVVRNTVVICSL